MADNTTALPPPPPPRGGDDRDGRPSWWRGPLIVGLVLVPIALAAGGFVIGCSTSVLDPTLCGAADAPIGQSVGDVEISGGQTTISVTDPDGSRVTVAQEPTSLFPG